MNREVDQPIAMVIEPDVLVRMDVAGYLRECGYRVIEGITAADVWTFLQGGGRFDVLLSDVNLAGDVDGFALATRIRQTYSNVDVILTSGISGAADKARDLCGDGPIRKPYHPKDVAARITVLRERRRASGRV
jgi:DNA-binding response OmpR family regulator